MTDATNERKAFIGTDEVDFMHLKPGDKFILTESTGELVALCVATGHPFIKNGVEGISAKRL